jgi:hypothetical protein
MTTLIAIATTVALGSSGEYSSPRLGEPNVLRCASCVSEDGVPVEVRLYVVRESTAGLGSA